MWVYLNHEVTDLVKDRLLVWQDSWRPFQSQICVLTVTMVLFKKVF